MANGMAAPGSADPGRPRPICIAGPTASGKSALALALAAHLPIEIVSVDSALVYRGMDIGTAKPTAAERAAVPHHLIDICDPRQAYSAAEFVHDATRLIAAIQSRGRHPVLVGGTMLYFKALLEGLHDMPPADPEVRRQIDERARQLGWPALHAELARVDPVTAARLPPGDSQRIQRALEVWQMTGRALSSFHATEKAATGFGENASVPPLPQPFSHEGRGEFGPSPLAGEGAPEGRERGAALFSLEPADRAWLHQRIARRFDAMLDGGLLDEVAALRARGDLSLSLPSMRCVGYRQAWEALDAAAPEPSLSAAQRAALRERGIAATRQLAKRQLTWLRGMARRRALVVDEGKDVEALALEVLRDLGACVGFSPHGRGQG